MIESERLVIKKFQLSDDEFIYRLLNTDAWIKNIGDKNIKTLDDARNYLTTGPIKSYDENGYGGWLVQSKLTRESVGLCGFFKRDYLDAPDIGYAFLPEFWGNGYAGEASIACIDYAFQSLSFQKIYGICGPNNKSSIAVLEKSGLVFVKNFDDNNKLTSLYEKFKN